MGRVDRLFASIVSARSVVWHSARGSRRFRCRCGALHEWPLEPRRGRRATVRAIECPCGQRHER